MKKNIFSLVVCTLTLFSLSARASSFYDNSAKDLDGKKVNFSKYKGKTLLIVNTATGCGYTPQLKGMQQAAKAFDSKKFEVLGFPSNSFKQEALEGKKIKDFCFSRYGAKFSLFEKMSVRGKDINPIFDYLVKNSSSPKQSVSWNFEKFVVGPKGKVLGRFKSKVDPMSPKITSLIRKSIK